MSSRKRKEMYRQARAQTRGTGRKSTALITLALVPLGLLGLGYVACDPHSGPDVADTIDDEQDDGPREPELRPMLAEVSSPGAFGDDAKRLTVIGPDGQPYQEGQTYAATPGYSWRPTGFFPVFMPVPIWSVPYRPSYAAGIGGHPTGYMGRTAYSSSSSYRYGTGFWSSTSGVRSTSSSNRSSSGYSSSSGSRSSSYSSGTSRGGFGSTGHSMSSSSSSS